MAHNDTEVEIKIPLSAVEFSRLKERLQQIAKFEKTTQQVDSYYTPAHRNFLEPEFPFEWLSIRKRGSKAMLNYKHYYPENSEIHSHCDEFETSVENSESLEKVFAALGFKHLVTVEKERQVFVCDEEFDVCLDSVKELGYFVEIEALKDFGSIEESRKRLFALAKTLGLDAFKTEQRGYPFLLLKKKGKIDSSKFLTR